MFVGPAVPLPFVALAAGVNAVAPAENIPNGSGGGGQNGQLASGAAMMATLGVCAKAASANAATQIQKPMTASHLCFRICPLLASLHSLGIIRSPNNSAHGGRGCGSKRRPPNVLKVLVALSFFPFLRRLFPAFPFAFICILPVKGICDGPALPYQVLVFHHAEIQQHAKLSVRGWKWQ
jgi:hypothetical protein